MDWIKEYASDHKKDGRTRTTINSRFQLLKDLHPTPYKISDFFEHHIGSMCERTSLLVDLAFVLKGVFKDSRPLACVISYVMLYNHSTIPDYYSDNDLKNLEQMCINFQILVQTTFMGYSKSDMRYTKMHRLSKPAALEIKLFGIPRSTCNDRMEGRHHKIKEKFHFSNKSKSETFYASKSNLELIVNYLNPVIPKEKEKNTKRSIFTAKGTKRTWYEFMETTNNHTLLRQVLQFLNIVHTSLEDYWGYHVTFFSSLNAQKDQESESTNICVASSYYHNAERYDDVQIFSEDGTTQYEPNWKSFWLKKSLQQ